jgi:hypothetical protein
MLLCDAFCELSSYVKNDDFGDILELKYGLPAEITRRDESWCMDLMAAALIGQQIKHAEHLILSDAAITSAIFAMSAKPSTLSDCLEVARFPWEHAWIEWNEGARLKALSLLGPAFVKPMGGPTHILMPKKIGLLVKTDKEGRAGTIFVGWSNAYDDLKNILDENRFNLNPKANIRLEDVPRIAIPYATFDFDRLPDQDDEIMMSNKGKHHSLASIILETLIPNPAQVKPSDIAAAQRIAAVFKVPKTALIEKYFAAMESYIHTEAMLEDRKASLFGDVMNEFLSFIGITLLFCAKNTVSFKPEDRSKINKQRLKSGKTELLDHQVVHMRLNSLDRTIGISQTADIERRMHSVKGHFVRRGTAIFWRRQHLRWRHSSIPALANKKINVISGPVDLNSFAELRS